MKNGEDELETTISITTSIHTAYALLALYQIMSSGGDKRLISVSTYRILDDILAAISKLFYHCKINIFELVDESLIDMMHDSAREIEENIREIQKIEQLAPDGTPYYKI